jgi:hypothetical protein
MPISSDLVDNFRINVGRLWDGETAREQPVSVFIEPDGLLIESDDETVVRWQLVDCAWLAVARSAAGSASAPVQVPRGSSCRRGCMIACCVNVGR